MIPIVKLPTQNEFTRPNSVLQNTQNELQNTQSVFTDHSERVTGQNYRFYTSILLIFDCLEGKPLTLLEIMVCRGKNATTEALFEVVR
jgi:hypothetical protein